jgi:hypothetical protein
MAGGGLRNDGKIEKDNEGNVSGENGDKKGDFLQEMTGKHKGTD